MRAHASEGRKLGEAQILIEMSVDNRDAIVARAVARDWSPR